MSEVTTTPETPTTPEPEKKNLTEDLIAQLKKSKQIHDNYAKEFKTRYTTFEGKRLDTLRKDFRVQIPPGLNPRLCLEINSQLNDLFQEATYYKDGAENRLAALKATCDGQFRDEFTKLVNEYKTTGQRLPAKDTLTQLAEYKISALKDALVHAEIEINFWKDVLSNLTNARKLIDNGTINLSVEAKAINQERYIDKLNSNSNGG